MRAGIEERTSADQETGTGANTEDRSEITNEREEKIVETDSCTEEGSETTNEAPGNPDDTRPGSEIEPHKDENHEPPLAAN